MFYQEEEQPLTCDLCGNEIPLGETPKSVMTSYGHSAIILDTHKVCWTSSTAESVQAAVKDVYYNALLLDDTLFSGHPH